MRDPFASSSALAQAAADILGKAGLDELAEWRMVEYWVQAELYRAAEQGALGPCSHFGDYEQPYYTRFAPKSNKKQWKWADLVLASPRETPRFVIWLELKDLGCSPDRLEANMRGVGVDLAALVGLDLQETGTGWREILPHLSVKARNRWWEENALALGSAEHRIAQVVVARKGLVDGEKEAILRRTWLDTCTRKVGGLELPWLRETGRAETERFLVLAIVGEPLPGTETKRAATSVTPGSAIVAALHARVGQTLPWSQEGFADGEIDKRLMGQPYTFRPSSVIDDQARKERFGLVYRVEPREAGAVAGFDLELRFGMAEGAGGSPKPYVAFYVRRVRKGEETHLTYRPLTVADVDEKLPINEFFASLLDTLFSNEEAAKKAIGIVRARHDGSSRF